MKLLNKLTACSAALAVLLVGCVAPAFAVEEISGQTDFYQWAASTGGVPECVWERFSGDADAPASSDLADAYAAYVEAIPISSYVRSADGSAKTILKETYPSGFPTPPAHAYPPDTRPACIAGNYFVASDGGKAVFDNRPIVVEDSMSLYNPVTGNSTAYVGWRYTYGTRSYDFNNGSGVVSSVVFGDDCITITEGDTEYTVYYGAVRSDADSGDESAPDRPIMTTPFENYTVTEGLLLIIVFSKGARWIVRIVEGGFSWLL